MNALFNMGGAIIAGTLGFLALSPKAKDAKIPETIDPVKTDVVTKKRKRKRKKK